MTLALAQSLIRNKGYNRDDVILSYQTWANGSPTGMGVNTRCLFKGIKTTKGFWSRHAKGLAGKLSGARAPLTDAKSNGSLMRCSPLALLKGYNAVDQDVNLTNPTDINIECSRLYIKALRLLHKGNSPESVYDKIKLLASELLQEVFEMIDAGTERSVLDMKGYVVHAFYCAMLSLVMIKDSFAHVIDHIINLGGDTDTNAAIAGALIGMYLGFDKMMAETVTMENYVIMTSVEPTDSECPTDALYTPDKIELIAKELVDIF